MVVFRLAAIWSDESLAAPLLPQICLSRWWKKKKADTSQRPVEETFNCQAADHDQVSSGQFADVTEESPAVFPVVHWSDFHYSYLHSALILQEKEKSWVEIIQEISVIRECVWVETIVNPGPIPCKVCRLMMEAGSVGALNCLLFGWSLMPAGKTLCRSVDLSFCTFIRNFLCNRQILILIFIQHWYKKVSPQTGMMWMSMQHFFFLTCWQFYLSSRLPIWDPVLHCTLQNAFVDTDDSFLKKNFF